MAPRSRVTSENVRRPGLLFGMSEPPSKYWFQDVAITSSGLGLTDVNYKRNLDVVQQDRDGVTLRRWSLSRAWPIKFVAGEWDNESDENVIEQVTLTYDFFELVQ